MPKKMDAPSKATLTTENGDPVPEATSSDEESNEG